MMWWSLLVAAVLAGLGGPALPERAMPRLIIRVIDQASVPAAVLADATLVAQSIFRKAGIETEWLPLCSLTSSRDPTLYPGCAKLVPRNTGEIAIRILPSRLLSRSVGPLVLGSALPNTRSAYVYYDHLENSQLADGPLYPALLGAVMAHEAGHLLGLPHAITGVMRDHFRTCEIDELRRSDLGFIPSQSAQLRSVILAHRVWTAVGFSNPSNPRSKR